MNSKDSINDLINKCLKIEIECLGMWKKGIYHRKAIQIKMSENNIKYYKDLKTATNKRKH